LQQRIHFIEAARAKRISFTSLCEVFGISTKIGYKWLARANAEGMGALEDRSRRPHSNSAAVQVEVVERLVELRKEHPRWGARKLLAWLEEREPWWLLPAASTATDILKRHGLVASRARRRRGTPCKEPLAHATAPNVVWAIDFKGDFLVADGTRCYPLTVTDAFSRMALCTHASTTIALPATQRILEKTLREWGLPERLRSDNGPPFGTHCTGPLSRLSVWLLKLGVRPEYTDPASPQQNGRHERYHRTLKEETCFPPAASIPAQQRRFHTFRREYNDERPHEALGQVPPSRVHVRSSRPFPARVDDPDYPGHYERRRITPKGYLRRNGDAMYLAESLGGEVVGIVEVENGQREVYFGPLLVGRIHDALPDVGVVRPARLLPMCPV